MNISSYIARRYFFARTSGNAVNIISAISILGILVGSAALIIVLSAFNGLETLVGSFYNTFDPALKVEARKGKYFELPQDSWQQIREEAAVEAVSSVLEDRVLLNFNGKEYIATIKGVDENYLKVNPMEKALRNGEFRLEQKQEFAGAVLGVGVSYFLGYGAMALGEPVEVFVPRPGVSAANFNDAFNSLKIYPQGIFQVQPEFDEKYVLSSLAFARRLLNQEKAISAIEIKAAAGSSIKELKERLQSILGDDYSVKNRQEQQEAFMKVMKSESLFTFLVFALILSIATFTIMGSLSMMMLDKREHLRTLNALGADLGRLRNIFFKEGLLISAAGALLGLLLGTVLVFLQQHYNLIGLGQGYVVDAYPVELRLRDIVLVLLTVATLSATASWLTSRRLSPALLAMQAT